MKSKIHPFLVFIIILISLSGCAPDEIVKVAPGPENSDQAVSEIIPSPSSISPTQNTQTVTPQPSLTQTPCPGQSIIPLCFEVDVYRVGETEPFLTGVEMGCGPSGAMVIRFNADLRVTRNLDLIREGERQLIELNFACLSQIDYVEMEDDEIGAVASFHELKGPDSYYHRQWKKVTLTFVDGSVWENVYLYDTCCYKSPSETNEESLRACVNPIGENKVSDLNEGKLNDFEVTKIIFRRRETCP